MNFSSSAFFKKCNEQWYPRYTFLKRLHIPEEAWLHISEEAWLHISVVVQLTQRSNTAHARKFENNKKDF